MKRFNLNEILDPTIKPFGRFVKSQLEHGLNLLFDIRDLIIAFNEAKTVNNVMGEFVSILVFRLNVF